MELKRDAVDREAFAPANTKGAPKSALVTYIELFTSKSLCCVSAGAKIGHVAPCERRYMAV